ncbi:MAG TPA: site-2 protease family protein [candidate division Zixibacteria bacterium]|nr:site-2 protease family protein [candidate division Zixibacteria bacterium]
MFRNAWRLFSIGGIEVRIHASWLLIFALLTWSLATGFFPQAYRELTGDRLSDVTAWILGGLSALLLFISVLVHELAHSFMARARGLEAKSITLFLFGGVSSLSSESPNPGTEFLVAIVGPLTSLAIAGICFLAGAVVTDPQAGLVLGYLAVVNALVAGFNLIPGFPLDGGRVLRSIAWRATNSVRRATEIAATVGQVAGFGLILWGLATIFLPPADDFFSGFWLAAIGWFLQNAASASLQQVVLETGLRGVRVSSILRPDAAATTPQTMLDALIEDLLRTNRRAMPVVDRGELVGIVTISDISQVPSEARARTPVSAVMSGRDALRTVAPSASLTDVLRLLSEGDYDQLPVVQDGTLVGMLSRGDVIRQLQLRQALEMEG